MGLILMVEFDLKPFNPILIKLKILTKLIALFALFLVVFFTFAACAESHPELDPKKPVNLTIWHHYIGMQKDAFDSLINEFNNSLGKEKGVLVTGHSMAVSGDLSAMLVQAAKEEPGAPILPDIATAYPSVAYTLYNMDKLSPVDKYMTKDELDSIVPAFLEEGKFTSDDAVYIFPIAKSTEVIMLNGTAYEKFLSIYNKQNPSNQLSIKDLDTFEGIYKTAKAYYNYTDGLTPDADNDGKAFFGFDAPSNLTVIGYHQLGSDFFDQKNKTINLDEKNLKRIWDTYCTPTVQGFYGAYSFYRNEDIQTGDLIAAACSTAGANFFPKSVTYSDNTKQAIELKVLPYPHFEGCSRSAVQQGAGMIVTKSTPEREYAASLFLKWFIQPQRNTEFVMKTGYLPVTKRALDEILPDELEKLKDDAEYANSVKVLSQAMNMYHNYELYTYKPFDNSDNLRFDFEDLLFETAQKQREVVVNAVIDGEDYWQAVEKCSDERNLTRFTESVRRITSETGR